MIRRLFRWTRDERGAVSPMMVLLLVPLIGVMALAGEGGFWFMAQRQLQNAADSAVLAAAANNGTTYADEARSVAGQYSLKDGVSDVAVTPSIVDCPGDTTGTLGCYQVEITRKVPLYLTQIAGFSGDDTLSDGRVGKLIRAVAVARGRIAVNYCLIGLGSSANVGPGNSSYNVEINGKGTGFEDCGVRSNGTVKCTATDIGITEGDGQQGCDPFSDTSALPDYTDPYASKGISSLISAELGSNPCASPVSPGATLGQKTVICPTKNKLTANTTIGQANSVIYVYGTTLDLAGFNLSTTGTGSATIIFTGPNTTNLPTWFDNTKSGSTKNKVTITAPGDASATFKDFAIIADPKYTTTQPFNPKSSNKWDLNVVGSIYAPNTDISIQGAMESDIGSYSCISMVAKSVYVNGGSLDNDPLDCEALGYNLPETVYSRQSLVL